MTDAEKAPVKEAIEKLKETIKNGTTDQIKADTEALQKAFYSISEKLYQQSGAENAQGGQGFDPNANQGGQTNGSDGTYYNADYEDKTGK